jgi:DAK2 domain fusion protein YloV
VSGEASPNLRLVHEPVLTTGGEELLAALRGALAALQANQEEINDLNVFPVPDGDTGSNMYLTLRSAVEEAADAADPSSAAAVLGAAAHGSLMGARGNSGVILSQVLRGLAQGVEGQARLDVRGWAHGFAEARTVAYKAVMKPTEGTILSIIREAAEEAERGADDSADIAALLERVVLASHAAVARTTEQLQVLRDAGVVDAGGFGLAVILDAMSRSIAAPGSASGSQTPHAAGDRPEAPLETTGRAQRPRGRRGAAAVAAKQGGWGYCTEFLIHGPGLDLEALRDEMGRLGESALVVGDDDLVRVHIHTGEPAPLIALASSRGRLSKLKVEDISAQHHDVLDRAEAVATAEAQSPGGRIAPEAPRKAVGVVSVARGQGFRDILASLGADAVVEGGQTMNPSIEDLLNAVRAAHAETVVLLPNNGNVILTAEQVDGLIDECEVRVVPTRNLPQGISALLALEPDAGLDANVERMTAAIEHVHALEVTRAVRDSASNGHHIKAGDVLGILDDEIREVGSDEAGVIEAVLGSVDAPPELVTVYRGGDVTAADADALAAGLRKRFTQTEFEVHDGGQEHYSYVLSLE